VIVMFQFRVGTPPELKSTYVLQILGFLISYPKNLNAAPVLHGWKYLLHGNIKMTFTLTALVESKGCEIGFRGLF
jgi:hypothetical protein